MRLSVMGAGGRMGQMLVKAIAARSGGENGFTLVGASERADSPAIGKDAGELAGAGRLGVIISADAKAALRDAQVVIDFTAPKASLIHADLAAAQGAALVLGTTGFDSEQLAAIDAAARKIAIVRSGNMSLGVNLLTALVERAAATLDGDFDIEIVEMHHKHKVDAPSGTALMLGEAAAAGRGIKLAQVQQRARDGITGARRKGDIGFASLRGGDVVGDHTVIFAGAGERIELTHKASSRELFVGGALRAAGWTRGKAPGLYSMKDVLGLN